MSASARKTILPPPPSAWFTLRAALTLRWIDARRRLRARTLLTVEAVRRFARRLPAAEEEPPSESARRRRLDDLLKGLAAGQQAPRVVSSSDRPTVVQVKRPR